MIEEATVLILGAGASRPYGYPLGTELMSIVSSELQAASHSQFRADVILAGFTQDEAMRFGGVLKKANVSSVDDFLEHNPQYNAIAKVAIARALIPCEDASRLNHDWYVYLWKALNCYKDDFIHNQIAFITFNYDRSLEQFLLSSLQAKYNISESEASGLLVQLPIFHVHGRLSPLRGLHPNGRPYSTLTHPTIIKEAASGLRIIYDDFSKDAAFRSGLVYLGRSRRVFFLGMGFHQLNLERLSLSQWISGEKTFCTRLGITDGELRQVARRFPSLDGVSLDFGSETQDALAYLRQTGELFA